MRILLSLLTVTFALSLVSSPAAAGSPVCTIRGTAGPDTLVGTQQRDVICGFGGNDRLYGMGGNDVLRGGEGNDDLRANAGNDLSIGGPGKDLLDDEWGNDTMLGGGARDVVKGGPGDDRIFGEGGNDRLTGGSGDDLVDGGLGNDEIEDGDGADVLHGRDGRDRLASGRGTDRLSGGAGDDVLRGGRHDRLMGGVGGDDLYAGPGAAFGGPGVDHCPHAGSQSSCGVREDAARPSMRSVSVSDTSVDVTNRPQATTVSAGASDDLGLTSVYITLVRDDVVIPYQQFDTIADQVTGTVRRGTWRLRITVPIGVIAGEYRVSVRLVDRAGRHRLIPTDKVVRVADRRPDLRSPALTWLTSPVKDATIDHDSTEPFRFRASLTDDRSGVDLVWFCTSRVGSQTWGRCWLGRRVSGGATDGVWVATADASEFPAGTYNVDLQLHDRVGRESRWRGPDDWDPESPWPDEHPIPGGRGRFTIER